MSTAKKQRGRCLSPEKGQVIAKLGLIKDPVFNMSVVDTFNNEEVMEDED